MLRIKQVYDSPKENDGVRILVDRLWPRGLTRREARIDRWVRSIAPSDDLRKWFHQNTKRWGEFKKRYQEELETASKKRVLQGIKGLSKQRSVTLVYASESKKRNNAAALLEILKGKVK